jgi:hypothetical protein
MKLFCIMVIAAGLAGVCAGEDNPLPAGVESRDYQGWRESLYLNASEKPVQLVVVPGIGGRAVHFSLNGTNIFFENFASLGKTIFTGSNLWFGGYQCELGPDSRAIPEESQFNSKVQRWQPAGNYAVKVSGSNDPASGVIIEKEFVMAPDTGELGLIQRLKNVSDTNQSYSMRDRTVCKNGGFVILPLNKKSRFKKGWCYCYETQGKWVYDGEPPAVPQAEVMDGFLVVQARGNSTRLGADSGAGWIAYVKGSILFIKYFPVYPRGDYSDGGIMVSLSYDQQSMQFGPVSPEFKLDPGAQASFPEKWVLIDAGREITTADQARKLVKKIPASPF